MLIYLHDIHPDSWNFTIAVFFKISYHMLSAFYQSIFILTFFYQLHKVTTIQMGSKCRRKVYFTPALMFVRKEETMDEEAK